MKLRIPHSYLYIFGYGEFNRLWCHIRCVVQSKNKLLKDYLWTFNKIIKKLVLKFKKLNNMLEY